MATWDMGYILEEDETSYRESIISPSFRIDPAHQAYETHLKLLYSIFLVFPLRIRRLLNDWQPDNLLFLFPDCSTLRRESLYTFRPTTKWNNMSELYKPLSVDILMLEVECVLRGI